MIKAARSALTLIARFFGKINFRFDCIMDDCNLEHMENDKNRATAKNSQANAATRGAPSMTIIAIWAIWLGVKYDVIRTVGVGVITSDGRDWLGSRGGGGGRRE